METNSSKLKKETVVIVGSNNGLGLSATQTLSHVYRNLILIDRNPMPSLAKKTLNPHCNFVELKVDITNIPKLTEMIRYNIKEEVNHLVYFVRAKITTSFDKIDENEWDLDFASNIKGAFFITQALLPLYSQNKMGTINYISSVSSELIGAESVSYHTSKAGLNHLIRYLAVHLGPRKIRVNGLSPGFIVQDRHKERFFSENNHEFRKIAEKCLPLQCVGHDGDVIKPLLFLLSDESTFINGQILTIDGGMSLQDQFYLTRKTAGNA